MAEADGVIVRRDRAAPGPKGTTGAAVHRRGGVGPGEVQNAVDDNGRNFGSLDGKLEGPLDLEAGDVLRIDFVERRKAMALEIARVSEPVARFFVSVDDALEGNLRKGCRARGEKECEKQGCELLLRALHGLPFWDARKLMRSSSSAAERAEP